jgi:hypothetical protein
MIYNSFIIKYLYLHDIFVAVLLRSSSQKLSFTGSVKKAFWVPTTHFLFCNQQVVGSSPTAGSS